MATSDDTTVAETPGDGGGPQGLLPERRRKLELTEGLTTDESLYETRA